MIPISNYTHKYLYHSLRTSVVHYDCCRAQEGAAAAAARSHGLLATQDWRLGGDWLNCRCEKADHIIADEVELTFALLQDHKCWQLWMYKQYLYIYLADNARQILYKYWRRQDTYLQKSPSCSSSRERPYRLVVWEKVRIKTHRLFCLVTKNRDQIKQFIFKIIHRRIIQMFNVRQEFSMSR